VFLPTSREHRETGRHWMQRGRRSTSYTRWVESSQTVDEPGLSAEEQRAGSVQASTYSTSETLAGLRGLEEPLDS
jgi:hypothetical protein